MDSEIKVKRRAAMEGVDCNLIEMARKHRITSEIMSTMHAIVSIGGRRWDFGAVCDLHDSVMMSLCGRH